ncbi:Non-receptor tyrosine kinase [Tieghemostelium lacteum]|uniref:Non-receptor tyrosine kinase n=1 Tax=Tieghemostelium lacteum TaxID=361077 RepID=A0A151ZI37_TIELA|nr:Non-receptor tyrosine kinase [Tieghemostelium lacteum]|eukprot:KYQ93575.1 Non-receptor tyrosine kinase [Tieghemostelium lacteum]
MSTKISFNSNSTTTSNSSTSSQCPICNETNIAVLDIYKHIDKCITIYKNIFLNSISNSNNINNNSICSSSNSTTPLTNSQAIKLFNLPNYIIVDIVEIFLNYYANNYHYLVHAINKISLVCKSWKYQLLSKIHIKKRFDMISNQDFQDYKNIIKKGLRMNATSFINELTHFHFVDGDFNLIQEYITDMIFDQNNIAISNLSHFKKLKSLTVINGNSSVFNEISNNLKESQHQQLRDCTIMYSAKDSINLRDLSESFKLSSKQLNRLSLISDKEQSPHLYSFQSLEGLISLSSISIEFISINYNSIISVIQNSTSLKSLELKSITVTSNNDNPQNEIDQLIQSLTNNNTIKQFELSIEALMINSILQESDQVFISISNLIQLLNLNKSLEILKFEINHILKDIISLSRSTINNSTLKHLEIIQSNNRYYTNIYNLWSTNSSLEAIYCNIFKDKIFESIQSNHLHIRKININNHSTSESTVKTLNNIEKLIKLNLNSFKVIDISSKIDLDIESLERFVKSLEYNNRISEINLNCTIPSNILIDIIRINNNSIDKIHCTTIREWSPFSFIQSLASNKSLQFLSICKIDSSTKRETIDDYIDFLIQIINSNQSLLYLSIPPPANTYNYKNYKISVEQKQSLQYALQNNRSILSLDLVSFQSLRQDISYLLKSNFILPLK